MEMIADFNTFTRFNSQHSKSYSSQVSTYGVTLAHRGFIANDTHGPHVATANVFSNMSVFLQIFAVHCLPGW